MFYLIDHACHQMKNTSRKINLHGGVEKLDPNVSIPATWADHSNNDINSSQSKFKIQYCKCMNSQEIEHRKFITDLKIVIGAFWKRTDWPFSTQNHQWTLKLSPFFTACWYLLHNHYTSLYRTKPHNAPWQNKVVLCAISQNMFWHNFSCIFQVLVHLLKDCDLMLTIW